MIHGKYTGTCSELSSKYVDSRLWDVYTTSEGYEVFNGYQTILLHSETELTAWLSSKKILTWVEETGLLKTATEEATKIKTAVLRAEAALNLQVYIEHVQDRF